MQNILKLILLFLTLNSAQLFAINVDMPTPYGEENYPTQISIDFAKEVSSRTTALNIIIHPGGTLYKHTDIFPNLQKGTVKFGEVFGGRLGDIHPIFKVDNIPFLATDFEEAEKLFTASLKTLKRELLKQNAILLYATPWPAQSLYSTKTIRSLEDTKDLIFRTYSPTTERLVELMGAIGKPIDFGDIAESFKSNSIDAMITSPSTGVSQKSWEYISDYSEINAWIPKNITLVNADFFNSLNSQTQEIILSAAAKAQVKAWQFARLKTLEHTKILEDNGIKISRPSLDLLEELRNIGYIMTDEWIEIAGETGTEIVDLFLQCT